MLKAQGLIKVDQPLLSAGRIHFHPFLAKDLFLHAPRHPVFRQLRMVTV
jgi:hypothetical protein